MLHSNTSFFNLFAFSPALLFDCNVLFDNLGEFLLMVLCPLKEFVLEQLGGTWPQIWILGQAVGHKPLEERAPLAFDRWRLQLNDIHDNLMLTLFDIGRVSIGHLVCEDTKGPDVNLAVIAFLSLDQLRGHPAHSAHTARPNLPL